MKTALLVDDEKLFLRGLADGLGKRAPELRILTANHGREAVEILERETVDLVVTDLRMPEMDGFELLAFLSTHHPALPIIVMTAFGTPETEEGVVRQGAWSYIEKPPDLDHFSETVRTLLSGDNPDQIRGIALSDLLQLLALERKTCQVVVKSENREGVMELKDGELWFAAFAGLDGEEAAGKMVCWSNAAVEIRYGAFGRKKRNINIPLHQFMLDAMRRFDEEQRDSGDLDKIVGDVFREVEPPPEVRTLENPSSPATVTPATQHRGWNVNLGELRKSFEALVTKSGEGLVLSDIWDRKSGSSIIGHNTRPEVTTHLNDFTNNMDRALREGGFSRIHNFYAVDLDENLAIVIVYLNSEWLQGILFDTTKLQTGMVLNIIVPQAIKIAKQTITQTN